MKEEIKKLLQQAHARLEDLHQQTEKLSRKLKSGEKNRIELAANVKAKSYNSDKAGHFEAEETYKSLTTQLDRATSEISKQQQYITTLTNQYLQLVSLEKNTQQASAQAVNTLFSSHGGNQLPTSPGEYKSGYQPK